MPQIDIISQEGRIQLDTIRNTGNTGIIAAQSKQNNTRKYGVNPSTTLKR